MASLKALLVSAGAVSISVVALVATVPSISGPLDPRLPSTLGWFRSWFRPSYPFVIVNVIIVAIAATSRCFRRAQPERPAVTVVEKMEIMEVTPAAVEAFDEFEDFEEKRVVLVVVTAAGNGRGSDGGDGYNGDCEGERNGAFGRSTSARRRRVDSSEKAQVPRRPVRRKAAGGDHLQVRRQSFKKIERKQGARFESDTGGGDGVGVVMSATRQVKADDTNHQISLPEPLPSMQKSVMFEDWTAQQPPLSPITSSEDDLNCQFEAFINKMKRFHRQELVNQYE